MADKNRVFFVIDMKSFFASVECAERGLDPFETNLVVADEARTKGTVCLAITPKMKSLGVKNRCRLFEIPASIEYIVAKPRMKKYIEYAAKIYEIYLKYIDKNDIHVYSIDECFIDVTSYLKLYKMKAKEFANKLMAEIRDRLGIPSSVGIGTNMFLAKIALDITAKHAVDRIGWLDEEKFKKELWHHTPITDFWSISTGTEKRLSKFAIFTMYDLAHFESTELLYKEFGINAELLIDHAWGRETCLISDIKNYKRKSISFSSSQILPCAYMHDKAKLVLKEMIQTGCYNLARHGYVTNHVHVFVVYQGDKKESVKASVTMREVTNAYSIIVKYVEKMFDNIVDKTKEIRKLGYDFSSLMTVEQEQYDFFTDIGKIDKEKKIVESVIKLQDKYGKNAVLRGMDLEQGATQKDRNALIGGHNGE
ncbi:MAG: DNA repair protein [Clostridia bacterium]|nr:DNA repair protein [Clostridia bacterium]